MRSVAEIQAAMMCSEEEAAIIARARDALGQAAQLSELELAAVEDYVVGLCLALGTTKGGVYKVSPKTIFGVATLVIAFGNLGQSLNDWAAQFPNQVGPMLAQEPLAQDAWEHGYRGFMP